MGRVSVSVHSLFIFFGIYYLAIGKGFVFLMVTICAIVHELGHSLVAEKNGYKLDKIVLMPFGAVVKGDFDEISAKDQIKIALAGPLVNLAVGIFFVAIWWIYPETYTFTDVVVQVCFSLALINLLPAYPLDGGKILYALLCLRLNKQKALLISKLIGIIFGITLLTLFVFSCFVGVNFSLLFFSLFIIFGALQEQKAGKYVKVLAAPSLEKLKRGLPYKKQGIDAGVSLKKLISILDQDAINEVVVFKNGKVIATLSQENIEKTILNHSIYDKLEDVFG